VESLSKELQDVTGKTLAEQAQKHGIELVVVKLEEPKRGFLLLPKLWAVEQLCWGHAISQVS
jgi:hypothetical protein